MNLSEEFIHEHRALIAVAEACQRPKNPSQSWHVFDWMAYRLRLKYPLIREQDRVINLDVV